ncbi:hypothetical protein pb186bvf_008213 [Paramecium bursaria]
MQNQELAPYGQFNTQTNTTQFNSSQVQSQQEIRQQQGIPQNQGQLYGQPMTGIIIQPGVQVGTPFIQSTLGFPVQQQYIGSNFIFQGDQTIQYQANDMAFPVQIKCPNCKNQIITNVLHEPGSNTFATSYLLFITTFFLCCWLPFCIPECQDKVHHCPNCGVEVGIKPFNFC